MAPREGRPRPNRARDDLRQRVCALEGRGYKAYQGLRGTHRVGDLELAIDRVQADPFAAPSKLRLRVGQELARIPEDLYSSDLRRLALRDWLARRVRDRIVSSGRARRGSGGSGRVEIDAGGQEILERSAVELFDGLAEARLSVGLPARGRRILAREAAELLCDVVPDLGEALMLDREAQESARAFVACAENQAALQRLLHERGWVAFVADGAILPRESGAEEAPLGAGAVPFRAPESLRVSVEVPHPPDGGWGGPGGRYSIAGMAIPRGITLIVGGGYHGKSTLLRALQAGVYFHIPGDGREYVVCDPSAVKLRAEDGRRVAAVDISAFIGDLPQRRSTRRFCSADASGSTSQAANLVEALEVGARVLLLDEDTCATNFMARDARMRALIPAAREPITPFVDRVRALHAELGVSTVLVMGGTGSFFEVADHVIGMDHFIAADLTAAARRIAAGEGERRGDEPQRGLPAVRSRTPDPSSLDPSRGRRDVQVTAKGRDLLLYGVHAIDLRAVEQLVDPSQTRAIGAALEWLRARMDAQTGLADLLDALDEFLDARGVGALTADGARGGHPGALARPRRFEVAAALNRLRTLEIV